MNAYCEFLARKRKLLGKSQTDFANALHYSAQAIAKYEKGQAEMSVSQLLAAAKFLEVDPDSLLQGNDKKENDCADKNTFNSDLFCKNLRNSRLSSGYSLTQLAGLIGVSSRSLKNYEEGKSTPSFSVFSLWLKATKQQASTLLTGEVKAPALAPVKPHLHLAPQTLGLIVFLSLSFVVGGGGVTYALYAHYNRGTNPENSSASSSTFLSSSTTSSTEASSSQKSGDSSSISKTTASSSSGDSSSAGASSSSSSSSASGQSSSTASSSSTAASSSSTGSSSASSESSASSQSSTVSSSAASSTTGDPSLAIVPSSLYCGKSLEFTYQNCNPAKGASRIQPAVSDAGGNFWSASLGHYNFYCKGAHTIQACLYDFTYDKRVSPIVEATIASSPLPSDLYKAALNAKSSQDYATSERDTQQNNRLPTDQSELDKYQQLVLDAGYLELVDKVYTFTAKAPESFRSSYTWAEAELATCVADIQCLNEQALAYSEEASYFTKLL